MRRLLQLVDADAARGFIEEHVAGMFQRAAQIQRTVPAPFPAVELMIAEGVNTGAEHGIARHRHTGVQRRQCRHRLEGRSGWIGARQHLVQQRLVIVVGQGIPFRGGNADIEQIGIESGRRHQRDDIAGFHIHHRTGRTFAAQALGCEFLHILIDGEIDILPRRAGVAAQFADHAAIGVHFHAADTGLPAYLLVKFLLDTAFADTEIRQAQQRIVAVLAVFFADRGDVAHDMGQLIGKRIGAGLADVELHTRQVRQIEAQARKRLPVQILHHRNRNEGFVLRDLTQDFLAPCIADLDQPPDRVERFTDAAGRLLRRQQHAVVAPVIGQFDRETIQNPPPCRCQQAFVDAVLLGLGHELIEIEDLQLIEPARQYGENPRHAARSQQGAAREGRITALVLAVEQRHQGCTLSGPTKRRWTAPRTIAAGT